LAYGTRFFPGPQLRSAVRANAGEPAYQGWWVVFEHAFLYTTLTALVCLVAWFLLGRKNLLEKPGPSFQFKRPRATLSWGIGSGLIVVAFNLLLVTVAAAAGALPKTMSLGWHHLSGWVVAGNLFSNFYEEIIYRGFVYIAIRAVTGSAVIGVVCSSLLFGLMHLQYPIEQRIVLVIGGAAACVAYIKTRSIWAAWLNHEVVDVSMGIALG